MLKKNGTTLIVLLIIFIALLIVGRVFLMKNTGNIEQQPTNQTATSSVQEKNIPASEQPSSVTGNEKEQASQEDTVATCATNLEATTKKNKTEYDPTTILIGFPSTLSFSDALNLTYDHQIAVQNQSDAFASYPSTHVITGTVAQGSVFIKICELKQDSRIRYAGINPILNLHE